MFTRGPTHRKVRRSGAAGSRNGRDSRGARSEHLAAKQLLGAGVIALSSTWGCLQVLGGVEVSEDPSASVNGALPAICNDDGQSAGPCKGVDCQPGQHRCQGSVLQTCRTIARGWELEAQCASAALCDETAAECQVPRCAPQEYQCLESGELVVCNADRNGFQHVEQCESGAFCSSVRGQEGCQQTACTPGEQRCNGPQVEQCRSDRMGFDPVPPACASAALCRSDGSGSASCETPACQAGTFACNGRELQRCNDQNSGWTVMARCISPPLCNAGLQRCDAVVCEPGQQRCTGSVLERCNPTQNGYAAIVDCVNPALCDTRVTTCLSTPAPTPQPEPPPPDVTSTTPYTFVDAPKPALLGLSLAQLRVPAEWPDVDPRPWVDQAGQTLGPSLVISTDAARFATNFDIPGVRFAATTLAPLDVASRLAELDLSARCSKGAADGYDDDLYTGARQDWINCGATGARTSVVVAVPRDNPTFIVVVMVAAIGPRDDIARQNVWQSFLVGKQ